MLRESNYSENLKKTLRKEFPKSESVSDVAERVSGFWE
jgi:hypothetical protein